MGIACRSLTAIAAVCIIASFIGAGSVLAAKVCKPGHWHYGSGSEKRTKKAAKRDAIAAWAGFVAFEYGNGWAYFSRAANRGVKCVKAGGQWSCNVEGRPCIKVRTRKRRRKVS